MTMTGPRAGRAAWLAVLPLLLGPGLAPAGEVLSLAGEWALRLDPDDRGLVEGWWRQPLPDRVRLPGALQSQGFGEEVSVATRWTGQIVDRSWYTAPEYEPYRRPGNVKVPFWLQPERHYVGPAWYARDVDVPESWHGRRLVLTLERPHWETRLWLDGKEVGTGRSLSTPHVYDLGTGVTPGRHRLVLRVDNRLVVDVGINSHSVSDHTQGNWNGVVGRLELSATAPVWVEDLQVYPHVAARSVTVKGRLGNATGRPGRGTLLLAAAPVGGGGETLPERRLEVAWDAHGGSFECDYLLGEGARAWDEFDPALYRLTGVLDGGPESAAVTFGLREVATQGTQFVLNGRKLFLRGTVECCVFPRTGYPPTDVGSWKRIIGVAKAHGLNHFRFHSWCPPEAAFVAADELGFSFHVECASWANTSTALGEGQPIDHWLYEEADRILRYYGNHPSFLLMAYGNEPAGKVQEYLSAWVEHYKARDGRRLYTAAAGWPQLPENQYHVTPDPRIQAWGAGLTSRLNARPPETRTDYRAYVRERSVPVVSHEIGQWCVYPNVDEIPKYTGPLKPKNFDIFRDSPRAHHQGGQARDFLLASGKLQTLCYKEEIESALRTPGMGGFQLLSLNDFPGQGTALVGVLDPFWESKGYVSATEFRRFCNSTAPLARMDRRVWTTADTLTADVEAAHFGPAPLEGAVAVWRLVGPDGRAVAEGRLPPRTIPVDNGVALGRVQIDLRTVPAPRKYRLVVGLEGTPFENDWDGWVYPAAVKVSPSEGVLVVDDLDDKALAELEAGSRVLWLVPPARVRGDRHGKVALGFSSIFWNTAWTGGQPPHTLGILCDPDHPALARFPTESHSNWQWWYLVSRAEALLLDDLPADVRPVVQVIDDWFTNRRLALVLEAKVGRGRLVACSIDLRHDLDGNPVARQLLTSLLSYMGSDRFAPAATLTPDQLRHLVEP
jgi:hypothetical protein